MPKEYKDLVVGLDIGTAKVMVVVAEVLQGGGRGRREGGAARIGAAKLLHRRFSEDHFLD